MLSKPKFMSPSTNMNTCTIDANANKIPFSCIVDGNESIAAWQIQVYELSDNSLILDTSKQILDAPFFPIDEKNRNNIFSIDLKPYIPTTNYFPADSVYDPEKTYYTRVGDSEPYTYEEYIYTTNSVNTWSTDYLNLYYYKDIFVNSPNAYYWIISFWSTSNKEKDVATVVSCEEVFYANSSPSIIIQYGVKKFDDSGNLYIEYNELTENTILNSRECYFKAIYTQDEDVLLKRYGWKITDIDSNQVLIDSISHNQIYGLSDNILCFYKGFLSGGNYCIELYVETQNNSILITSPITFSILYQTTFLSDDFKAEVLKKEPAIILDWSSATIIGGNALGKINYKTNYPIVDYTSETPNTSVVIPNGSSIVYNYGSNSNLDVSEDCYIVLSTQLHNEEEAILFVAEGIDEDGYELMRKLTFSSGAFTYTLRGAEDVIVNSIYEVEYQPNNYVWYIIVMSPLLYDDNGQPYINLAVTESKAINGVYPSETLYPSESLYSSFGAWDKLRAGDE